MRLRNIFALLLALATPVSLNATKFLEIKTADNDTGTGMSAPTGHSESGWDFSGSAGLTNSYFWAGWQYGGVSVVPELEVDYNLSEDWSLYAAVGATIDTGLMLPLSEDFPYNGMSVSFGFTYKGFNFYVDQEVYDWQFRDAASIYYAASFDWTISEDFPLTLSWYSVLYNPAPYEDGGEVLNTRQCHSSLFTMEMPFLSKGNFVMGAEGALVPWNSPFCGYDSFSVCQLGLDGCYSAPVGKNELPVTFHAGWNPAGKYPYCQIGVAYSF